jgi:hypothetical protein
VLEQVPIFGKIPPLEAADQEERLQEDRHFTLLLSTGHEASALRKAVSSSGLRSAAGRDERPPGAVAGILPV